MTFNGILLLAICGFSVIQAQSRQNLIPVDIQPEGEQAVKVGQNLTIICKSAVPLRVCRFEIPGEGSQLLQEADRSDELISYAGAGTKQGECGVFIKHVKEDMAGTVTCSLTPDGGRTESRNSVNIVVAKPPSNPELHVSRGSIRGHIFRRGEKMDISCMAQGGRPAANVSLFLDDESLVSDERPYFGALYNYPGPLADENVAVKNISRVIEFQDNGKVLRCVANHIALDAPLDTTKKIEVYFAPVPQNTIERFGYVIGRAGRVNVTIQANPRPYFTWKVDDERIDEARTDKSNRLESQPAISQGEGLWVASLTIDSVQLSDTKKSYILEATNDEGTTEYKINLSTSTEPAGVTMDAGSIIGIIVGVLLLILAVFIAIFARATGRWCFAARRSGDEEAAGGAGAGSEAHITPGDDDDDATTQHIIDEKIPTHGGQDNPIHASTEYVNGRSDNHHNKNKDNDFKKIDTPV